MTAKSEGAPGPTWWDWHQMKFWVWACLENGHQYLSAHDELLVVIRDPWNFERSTSPVEAAERRELAIWRANLAKYAFILSVGKTIRILRRSKEIFPSIHEAYSSAEHLIAEGPQLRNMIEHDEEYFAGSGRKQNDFVRGITDADGLILATADATSTHVGPEGHLLGGRFDVNKAIAELKELQLAVAKVPEP